MNDKPKDRTTKRMNIIAIILVLISAIRNLIYGIFTGEDGMGARFLYLFLVFLVIVLRREAVAGFFFSIFGLLVIIFVGLNIFTGEYESLLYEILRLVWLGLMPLIAGLLFLAIWRKTREPKVLTSSD